MRSEVLILIANRECPRIASIHSAGASTSCRNCEFQKTINKGDFISKSPCTEWRLLRKELDRAKFGSTNFDELAKVELRKIIENDSVEDVEGHQ